MTEPDEQEPLQIHPVVLGDAIADARRLLKGSKSALLLAFGMLLLALILSSYLAAALAPGVLSANPSALDNLLLNLVGIVLTAPLLGGLAHMTLWRARGNALEPGMIFSGFRFATRFLVYGLFTTGLSMLLVAIPFPINQIVWLALSALLSFTAYFIVDRDSSVPEAMLSSLRLVSRNLPAVLGWLALSFVLATIGVLTLGIGLIWVVPFIVLLNALIYDQSVRPPPEQH